MFRLILVSTFIDLSKYNQNNVYLSLLFFIINVTDMIVQTNTEKKAKIFFFIADMSSEKIYWNTGNQ